jgi:hypothetical protein
MTMEAAGVKSWEQASLYPTEDLRITLTISTDPMRGRHHVGIRWYDAGAAELLGIWVAPAREKAAMQQDLDELLRRVRELVEATLNPF